jgi:1-acyl-sn-glycerol-3-phosphate acyltransferase
MKAIKNLWQAYFYFVFMVFMLLLYPFFMIFIRKRKYLNLVHVVRKYGCRIVLFLSGVFVKRTIRGSLPKGKPVIYFGNHSSVLDIVTGMAYMPGHVHFVGKQELQNMPFIGLFFKWMDIPIHRNSIKKSDQALQKMKIDLQAGISIFIFPEGTTSMKAPGLLPFKAGAFKIALEENVPLIPVVFADNWRMMHLDIQKYKTPGVCRLIILPALEIKEKNREIDKVKQLAFQTLRNELMELWPDLMQH